MSIVDLNRVGPGKGLADAIAALSEVVPHVPGVRYIIAGTTHPEVARSRGEAYRDELRRVERFGVAERVYVPDEFLTEAELARARLRPRRATAERRYGVPLVPPW